MTRTILSDLYNVLLFSRDDSSGYIFNHDLLNYYQRLKKEKGLNFYIYTATNVNKILTQAQLKKIRGIFKKIFLVKDINMDKKNPQSYNFLANNIGADGSNIIFIDDSILNIKAAEKTGMKTIHYTSNKDVIEKLETIYY